MGSQQILLIILGIVIVAIAVAVGITIFNNTAVNASRHAIISDMMNFAPIVISYYKTPASLGGSSYGKVNWDEEHVKKMLGFNEDEEIETENAYYYLQFHNDPEHNDYCVIFFSVPKEAALDVEGKRPRLKVSLIYHFDFQFGEFKLDYY